MKLIAPDYYSRFHCRAGACRHTCCAGWEIDVDETSLERWRRLPGPVGEKLRSSVEGGKLRLREDGRCPMLGDDGLCELIRTFGTGQLCRICADHPRFRHFFSDREELGVGLCCEEAAELILKSREPFRLIELRDDGGGQTPDEDEQALFSLRDELMTLLLDRGRSIDQRLRDILSAVGADRSALPMREWAGLLRGLETMDPAWTRALDRLAAAAAPEVPAGDEPALEQLAAYLLYRWFTELQADEAVLFTDLAVRLIAALAETAGLTLEEAARMFSSEIEYSDENVDRIIGALLPEA